jgi:hypothetical protein
MFLSVNGTARNPRRERYEARRLATETHSNAVIAAALVVAAAVLTLYSRPGDAKDTLDVVLLSFGLGGSIVAFVLATFAREVSWRSRWAGGGRFGSEKRPERLTHEHWHARAVSAYELGQRKGRWLRVALIGFVGPLIYFAGALLA